jgi:putative N-acetyltransferase (TIGR04045 family)
MSAATSAPRAAAARGDAFAIIDATGDPARVEAYRRLRARAFVEEQRLFVGGDLDEHDESDATRVLVAVEPEGQVVGGVRLHPEPDHLDLAWWRGSRLVCSRHPGIRRGDAGAALVRAACATAQAEGALRFDAHVQERFGPFFERLGWQHAGRLEVAGTPHLLMRWPIGRFARLAHDTKGPLGGLLTGILPADAWLGDDGAPVAGTDVVACADAILPDMVARDPEWAGWCAMLVAAHDLSAMGAAPIAALDTLGAADAAHATRILEGLRRGSETLDLPIIGGHTQLGVAPALAVTALGRTADPVPASGGRPGDAIAITADVEGGWRPGYEGRQWDSSSRRTRDELRTMLDAVGTARPRAAKDVSMAGIVGTVGMLAEASGCGAELEVDAIPRPADAPLGEWLTCFPGFAMVTVDDRDAPIPLAGAAVGARCGTLGDTPGVQLRWPDGAVTTALGGAITGLGPAA